MRDALKAVGITLVLAAVLIAGVWVFNAAARGFAYGPHHGYYYNPENAARTTVTGKAVAFQPPFIGIETAGKKIVEVAAGPMMLWADRSFALNNGDRVEVEAAELSGPWGKRLVALKIKNLTTKKSLDLENATGGYRGSGRMGYAGGYYCDQGYGMHGSGPHHGFF